MPQSMSEKRFMAGFSVDNRKVRVVARIVDGKEVARLDGPNAEAEAQQLAAILDRASYVSGDPLWRWNQTTGGWMVGEVMGGVAVVWAYVLDAEDHSKLRKLLNQFATVQVWYHPPIVKTTSIHK
jgi:hypothetical protein